jgi:hypothetical protein
MDRVIELLTRLNTQLIDVRIQNEEILRQLQHTSEKEATVNIVREYDFLDDLPEWIKYGLVVEIAAAAAVIIIGGLAAIDKFI